MATVRPRAPRARSLRRARGEFWREIRPTRAPKHAEVESQLCFGFRQAERGISHDHAADMTGRRRATNSRLQQVETLFAHGYDNAGVARRLGCDIRSVRRYAAALRRVGDRSHDIKKGGRPRKLTARVEKAIVKEALEGDTNTLGGLVDHLFDYHEVICSKFTVRRALRGHKVWSCKKRKRALLHAKHRRDRLAFARRHTGWTADQWSKVLWSDESRRNLWGDDGPERVFRRRGAPLRDRDVTPRKGV